MAFEELKAKQSVMWGTGPYQNVTETITDIHERVVDRLAPAEGVTWLDLACGTGAVAERAAEAGADVTGVDLAPALIETAKERASEGGLDIDYRVGDCENLEFEDGAFDVVSSTCGVMFAPDHEATRTGAGPCRQARRPDRARELDSRREGPRRDLPHHEAVSTGSAAGRRRLSVRVGRRAARERSPRGCLRARARAEHLAASPSERRGVLAAVRVELRADANALRVARRRTARGAPSLLGRFRGHRAGGRTARSSTRASGCSCTGRAAERDRLAPRRGGDAPLGADPPRHRQPARERDAARRSTCAATSSRTASPASCTPRSRSARTSSPASRAAATGRRLALLSHTDTVLADPAEWELDPWSGELRDGEIWGRGALDMKGQVAASAVAMASLAREGFQPKRRRDLHRGRRRGGRRRLRARVALPGASGRRSRRVLDQRGRRRSDRARREAVLPRVDGREDELAVRAPRARAKRPRVDAVDRGQRARQGREADRAPRRVQAGAAARAGGVRALRGRGRCAAGGCEPGARGRASGRSDRRRARRAAARDDRLADDGRPPRRSGT